MKTRVVAKIRRTREQAYTSDWASISAAIRKRDGNKCKDCGKGPPARLEVHHIIPVSKGGRTVSFNLKTLCSDCHKRRH